MKGFVRRQRNRLAGMTLIEVMMAIAILAVGIAATLPFFAIAAAGNGRSKIDTQAVLVSQMFLEQISDIGAGNAAGTAIIKDCPGNTVLSVSDSNITSCTDTTSGCGCPLNASKDIDWTSAASNCGTSIASYTSCGTPALQYEGRWNIRAASGGELVSLSTRLKGSAAGTSAGAKNQLVFAMPVTLHTLFGQ